MEERRQKIAVANWKMNKTIGESAQFIRDLASLIGEQSLRVAIAVPFTALQRASASASDTPIAIGAQNIHAAESGPYTGEISAAMACDAGAQFTLVGHSERRELFQESNSCVNAKLRSALSHGLQPLLCIGEPKNIRQEGNTASYLQRQLQESLQGISADQLKMVMIAYEPIWAIGSGNVATLKEVSEVHNYCREQMRQRWGHEAAQRVPILYGGSVTADNCHSFLGDSSVDGVLVGGASLHLNSFSEIVNTQNLQRSPP